MQPLWFPLLSFLSGLLEPVMGPSLPSWEGIVSVQVWSTACLWYPVSEEYFGELVH